MNSFPQQSLQPHPESIALRGEIERFGETLTNLIVQRDYLQRSVLPNIAAEYTLKIGHLETRAFWLDCELRALKRRIELAQSALNAGDKPCYRCIEARITREFEEWRATIAEKQRQIRAAREYHEAPKMSAEKAKKLQTLYRSLAKKLHPDVSGEQTERARNLWQQTADAYRDGDVATLEALWLIIENQIETFAADKTHTIEFLREKREKLFQAIVKINDEIRKIRQETPYIWQNILSDEAEVERRRVAAETAIKNLREYRFRLTAHWALVMQSAKDGELVPDEPPALAKEDTTESETDFPEFLQ